MWSKQVQFEDAAILAAMPGMGNVLSNNIAVSHFRMAESALMKGLGSLESFCLNVQEIGVTASVTASLFSAESMALQLARERKSTLWLIFDAAKQHTPTSTLINMMTLT